MIAAVVPAILTTVAMATSTVWTWTLPAFFPEPRIPQANPMTAQKVELGRHLFFDPRLSGNGTQSCASCHDPSRAFTDGRRLAVGSTGQTHPRNSQGLANVVYHPTFTWANPALVTLEQQMEVPLFGTEPVEMGIDDGNKAEVLARFSGDEDYRRRFALAFPGDKTPVRWTHIIQAIAAFERTLLSGDSLYDRHLQGKAQLNAAQTRGLELFFGEKAECFHCHGSFNFNDQTIHAKSRLVDTPFHNTGLYNLGELVLSPSLTGGCSSSPNAQRTWGHSELPACATSRSRGLTCTTAASPPWRRSWTSMQRVAARSMRARMPATVGPTPTRTTSSTRSISMHRSAPIWWRF